MAECPVCGGDECRPIPQIGRLPRWAGGFGLNEPEPDEFEDYIPKGRRPRKGVEV